MATFGTPDHAVAAALAMAGLNARRGGEDLLPKIGIHEGPCLAVSLNDRRDYFGQTVNIASRVQNLATSRSIVATGAVAGDPTTRALIQSRQLAPVHRQASLHGINAEHSTYEIP